MNFTESTNNALLLQTKANNDFSCNNSAKFSNNFCAKCDSSHEFNTASANNTLISSNEQMITTLHRLAKEHNVPTDDPQFASLMDNLDELKQFRNEFFFPKMKDLPCVDLNLVPDPEEDSIYLCGNSLGLQPRGVNRYLQRELDKWAKMGVYGHFKGDTPWARCDEYTLQSMARLVGARKDEIAVMNGLSVNLHLMMVSFYRPTEKRKKILLEQKAFPSDHFVIESQIRFHGYDPEQEMIIIEPKEGEYCLRTNDILQCIEENGDEIALILFSGVQYYTGQLFDIPRITELGRSKGCVVGWDMAHAAGNVPLRLNEWQVDFAAWCSYKYLNASCGGLGVVFVHEKHARNNFPKFSGWWSDDKEFRMQMTNVLHLTPGAAGYRISNPPILLVCPLLASLDIFDKTCMEALRQKSILLTGYLEYLLEKFLGENSENRKLKNGVHCRIVTPRDPSQRGCQLSLKFNVDVGQVFEQLEKRGVVCDKRLPYVLRVTPIHLYNKFADVRRFLDVLIQSLQQCYSNTSEMEK